MQRIEGALSTGLGPVEGRPAPAVAPSTPSGVYTPGQLDPTAKPGQLGAIPLGAEVHDAAYAAAAEAAVATPGKPRRNRKTAKDEGARFERQVADVLKLHLHDDAIDRQIKRGKKDLGDIRGIRLHGMPIAIEVKNTSSLDLPKALREAEVERGNLDALAGVVVSKRRGIGETRPLEQLVSMTLGEFISLLTASRAHYDQEDES